MKGSTFDWVDVLGYGTAALVVVWHVVGAWLRERNLRREATKRVGEKAAKP
jgi:hypothetical protein